MSTNYKAASERTDENERLLTPPFKKAAPAKDLGDILHNHTSNVSYRDDCQACQKSTNETNEGEN